MATITTNSPRFNVIEYVHKLRKANFTQEQAETIAQETELLLGSVMEQTKQAMDNKELATRGGVLELELKIEKAKTALIRWVLGTGTGTILALVGLLKFMLH